MIKSVCKNDSELVLDFCSDGLLGTKIACMLNAYGTEADFFKAWYCCSGGEIKGAIAKLENNITVLCEDDCDFDEVKNFIEMLGFASLTCYEETAEKLLLENFKIKKSYFIDSIGNEFSSENIGEENYKNAYRLISENIPDSFENTNHAYLSFLSDFTFRKRRGMARMKGITDEGELLSCAMTAAETDKAALMSGVACRKGSRKTGLGKMTVLSLAGELLKEKKKVHIIALNESAEGFYEHIGFKEGLNIAICERK